MKLKRSAHMLYVKKAGTTSGSTNAWFLVGKDIDDLSVSMNGSFETKKNILDETSVTDEGYSPEIEVTPYYANPDDGDFYEFLRDIALGRKSGDDAKGEYLEVWVEDTADSSHIAYKENCVFEITSYAGGTTGLQIEYTIHPDGGRTKGTVALSNKVPTFTAGS